MALLTLYFRMLTLQLISFIFFCFMPEGSGLPLFLHRMAALTALILKLSSVYIKMTLTALRSLSKLKITDKLLLISIRHYLFNMALLTHYLLMPALKPEVGEPLIIMVNSFLCLFPTLYIVAALTVLLFKLPLMYIIVTA